MKVKLREDLTHAYNDIKEKLKPQDKKQLLEFYTYIKNQKVEEYSTSKAYDNIIYFMKNIKDELPSNKLLELKHRIDNMYTILFTKKHTDIPFLLYDVYTLCWYTLNMYSIVLFLAIKENKDLDAIEEKITNKVNELGLDDDIKIASSILLRLSFIRWMIELCVWVLIAYGFWGLIGVYSAIASFSFLLWIGLFCLLSAWVLQTLKILTFKYKNKKDFESKS